MVLSIVPLSIGESRWIGISSVSQAFGQGHLDSKVGWRSGPWLDTWIQAILAGRGIIIRLGSCDGINPCHKPKNSTHALAYDAKLSNSLLILRQFR